MALTEQQIKDILSKSRLEVTHKFEVPPVCLEIVNEDEHESAILGTYGNFSTYVAAPKIGKTTAIAIVVASYIQPNRIAAFQSHVQNGKEVALWIDTEQGKNEAVNTLKSICSFADLPQDKQPENLVYYPLREFSHSVRVQVTEYLINNTPNVGLVVIDGIRDLINSINDEREATFIAGKLLKWSEQKQIHIITILHQNKGDGNARGHLGTELMNKSETVITLAKDTDNGERQTIFEPKHTRHKDFKKFGIVLRNNRPQLVGCRDYVPTDPKVDQLTAHQITKVLNIAFEDHSFLTYSPLMEGITKGFETIGIKPFGIVKLKNFVTYLKENNYINHDEKTKQYQPNI